MVPRVGYWSSRRSISYTLYSCRPSETCRLTVPTIVFKRVTTSVFEVIRDRRRSTWVAQPWRPHLHANSRWYRNTLVDLLHVHTFNIYTEYKVSFEIFFFTKSFNWYNDNKEKIWRDLINKLYSREIVNLQNVRCNIILLNIGMNKLVSILNIFKHIIFEQKKHFVKTNKYSIDFQVGLKYLFISWKNWVFK